MEKNKVTRMCTKLSEKHISPNTFEKMRVSLAAPIFSKSAAAAIRTTVELTKFERNTNETAIAIANFIEKMDKIFDCMNGKSCYDRNVFKAVLKKWCCSEVY